MIKTKHPVFIFLALLLTVSSCQQNDQAYIFYHQINAIYAQKNNAVSYFLNGQQRAAQKLKSDLDKCSSHINELAPFAPGDSLKSAIMEELMMWNQLAELAAKKQDPKSDTTALTKETQDLQMHSITLQERVNAENQKFVHKFHLAPLNTLVEVEQPASR